MRFKIASEDWEFEAIHRLNYDTFVEEIPQHARNTERRLVDRFHLENTYAICLQDNRLVGMLAGRRNRPFSLDTKLPDLDSYLPAGRRVLEVRLLSVTREHRHGPVFANLVRLLARHFLEQGCDLAVISGTTRQRRLYEHLGFVPFGPLLGDGEARFQPMYLTLGTFVRAAATLSISDGPAQGPPAGFLPGPVTIRPEVRRAFERGPVSHRSEGFLADFRSTGRALCGLVEARRVEILLGSGTLANDAVCAQLSLLRETGLILSNGEFGDRLIDHATRQGLDFKVHRTGWGEPFDERKIQRDLDRNPRPGWLWAVHCETSSGLVNPLDALRRLCAGHGTKLCLDCISSIGTQPVDLRRVHLASCVSGKGLASYPGLSMVFADHPLVPAPKALPRYLDLGYYAAQAGVPFTHSSNLVHALQAAMSGVDWAARYDRIACASAQLRSRLRDAGFRIVAPETHAAPAVVTVALPADVDSRALGRRLRADGCLLHCDSRYLAERNWIQIAFMGEWSHEVVEALPGLMVRAVRVDARRRRHHAESVSPSAVSGAS